MEAAELTRRDRKAMAPIHNPPKTPAAYHPSPVEGNDALDPLEEAEPVEPQATPSPKSTVAVGLQQKARIDAGPRPSFASKDYLFEKKHVSKDIGDGLFATQPIAIGSEVLLEKSVFAGIEHWLGNEVVFMKLSDPQRRRIEALHSHCVCNDKANCTETPLMKLCDRNAIVTNSGKILFPTAAWLNHSCEPNLAFGIDETNKTLAAYANQDIGEGEELTINYGVYGSYEHRQFMMKAGYGFSCKCGACQLEMEICINNMKNNFIESGILAGLIARYKLKKSHPQSVQAQVKQAYSVDDTSPQCYPDDHPAFYDLSRKRLKFGELLLPQCAYRRETFSAKKKERLDTRDEMIHMESCGVLLTHERHQYPHQKPSKQYLGDFRVWKVSRYEPALGQLNKREEKTIGSIKEWSTFMDGEKATLEHWMEASLSETTHADLTPRKKAIKGNVILKVFAGRTEQNLQHYNYFDLSGDILQKYKDKYLEMMMEVANENDADNDEAN